MNLRELIKREMKLGLLLTLSVLCGTALGIITEAMGLAPSQWQWWVVAIPWAVIGSQELSQIFETTE